MLCFRVKKRLIPYMENTLDKKRVEAIARHLSRCARCSEELELIKRASGAFRSAKTPVQEPAADLWSRIEREITTSQAPAARKLPIRGLQLGGVAIAAAVILFAVVNVGRLGEIPAGDDGEKAVIARNSANVEPLNKQLSSKSNAPIGANTPREKRSAIQDVKNSITASGKESTGRSKTIRPITKQTGTTVMASRPEERNTNAAEIGTTPQSAKSHFDSGVRSVYPPAGNSDSIAEQYDEVAATSNTARTSNRAQNSANSAKPWQNTAEVAAASWQNGMNNASSSGLDAAIQTQRKPDESAKENQQLFGLNQAAPNVPSNIANAGAENKQAVAKHKPSLAADPSPENIRPLVDTYARSGILYEGVAEYEAALDKNPRDTVAMRFLTLAYARVGNQYARAQMARKLIKVVPAESAEWNRELGCALAALGDDDGAMSAWQCGLESNPVSDSSEILKEVAAAGMVDDLTKHYRQESSTGKTETPSLILASIYEFRGNFSKAVKIRRKLTESFPEKQQYWLRLGEDLLKIGDKDDAKAAFTKAAGMKEDQTIRALALKRLNELK